jgi:hypothetical protein
VENSKENPKGTLKGTLKGTPKKFQISVGRLIERDIPDKDCPFEMAKNDYTTKLLEGESNVLKSR